MKTLAMNEFIDGVSRVFIWIPDPESDDDTAGAYHESGKVWARKVYAGKAIFEVDYSVDEKNDLYIHGVIE